MTRWQGMRIAMGLCPLALATARIKIFLIGLIPGTFSTALYFVSAGKVRAHRTGVYMFIVPVGAIVSSWVVYGEALELSTLIECLMAFAAVILFNRKKPTSIAE